MLLSITAALFSLSALSSAAPARNSFKEGEVIVGPSAAFQIFSAFPDASVNLGSNSTPPENTTNIPPSNPPDNTTVIPPLSPPDNTTIIPPSIPSDNTTIIPPLSPPDNTTTIPPLSPPDNSTNTPSNASIISFGPSRPRHLTPRGISFNFHVSKGPNNTREDLVVSFANLPCPPASRGAYSFEFDFQPEAQYSSSGQGQINMFKINGPLPETPTYNNIQNITGSLIGTFQLPTGPDADRPKLIFINQLVCEPTINLRFAISQDSSGDGAVAYFNSDGMGLRERSGR